LYFRIESMAAVTQERIITALRAVRDPDRSADIVSLGLVSGVSIREGRVQVTLKADPARGTRLEPIRVAAEKAVAAVSGVVQAQVALTAQRPARAPGERPAPPDRAAARHGREAVPGVRRLIAVASGKGGVGKSTTAVNLALALASLGHRTAVLDADVYGPSIPRMLGIDEKPQSDGNFLIPLARYGLQCMSIGFLVPEERPTIWRGPMVMSALEQMLRQVRWHDVDIMVIDLPPGTGDVQLTLAQRTPLDGAVIISTPQDIALLDARKGLAMFRQVAVPILGIVENMSYFSCPHCGGRTDIFSHGGARTEAERLGVPFLGEIPLDIVIRETSDTGRPIVVSAPDSPHAEAYRAIARHVSASLESHGEGRAPPPIIVR